MDINTTAAITGTHTPPARVLTRTETAKLLGIGKATLDFLIHHREGFPEMVPVGKSKGFKSDEIEAWLNR